MRTQLGLQPGQKLPLSGIFGNDGDLAREQRSAVAFHLHLLQSDFKSIWGRLLHRLPETGRKALGRSFHRPPPLEDLGGLPPQRAQCSIRSMGSVGWRVVIVVTAAATTAAEATAHGCGTTSDSGVRLVDRMLGKQRICLRKELLQGLEQLLAPRGAPVLQPQRGLCALHRLPELALELCPSQTIRSPALCSISRTASENLEAATLVSASGMASGTIPKNSE